MSALDQAAWTERLARARAPGDGTVLDRLRRQPGMPQDALPECLQQRGGVAVFERAEGLRLDASALPPMGPSSSCVVVRDRAGQRWLACADPWDEATVTVATQRIGQILPLAAASGAALSMWRAENAADHGSVATEPDDGGAAENGNSVPVVAFVDRAIAAACELGASDVHFESDRQGMSAKHRIDGLMRPYARLVGGASAEEVISRIKVLAQLDITERRMPQDGRCHWGAGARRLDLRVSIMPSIFGEDAVLRLLDKARLRQADASISLGHLGFPEEQANAIREMASEPSGLLLVTGPTGSGKTTTLYAVLSEINDGTEKIITIEDPVEYELAGVLQIPVNERKGLTFSKGLRSILRHDPDRILVGEIRDAETAEISVQAALTGHLVFTTVHANSVADIIGRFRHFGLDMFGLMSSLNGVVVQRLVRRLCPHCRGSREASAGDRQWLASLEHQGAARVPQAHGCPACRGSGFSGRLVVAQVHRVDDALRDLVTHGAPLSAIKSHTEAQAGASLADQAVAQVLAGETTLEEIKRVVGGRR